MEFQASLHKFSVDREGEVTLVLKVPNTDVNQVFPMMGMAQSLLKVKIYQA